MRNLLFISLLFVLTFAAKAQKDSIVQYRHTVPNLHYLGSIITDLGHTTVAPLKWKRKQWMTLGAVGTATIIIMTNDLWIQQTITNNTSSLSHWSAKNIFEPAANYQFLLGTSTGLYALGLITSNNKHKRAGLMVIKSYLVAGALGQLLKQLGSRWRPYQFNGGDPNPYQWEGVSMSYNSFPSGHTTAAFAIATTIATIYKDTPIIPVIAYGTATMAGLSRIHDNQHWASDVLAGAALGWSVARFLLHHDNKYIKTIPYVNSHSAGISLQYTF